MVYAATHLSLALLEQLVHATPATLPDQFRAFAIEVPDEVAVEVRDSGVAIDDLEATRREGDEWAASLRTAVLIVPSAIVPAALGPGAVRTEERNVLLNPRHSAAARWRAEETSFRVDPRLRGAGGKR